MKFFGSKESEAVLINQMVLDPSIIPNVYDTVKPDAFSVQSYRTCYEHLIDLVRKASPIDEVVFRLELKKDVPVSVIDEVLAQTYTASNWEFYAGKVKECYISRSISELMSEMQDRLNEQNGAEIVNELLQKASQISSNTTSCEVYDIKDLAADYIQQMQQRMVEHKEMTGIPTGLKNLDEVTQGIQPEYIVIGARPSLGKTALGQQMALHTAGMFGGEGLKTLFVELEMSPRQLTERAIANMTHLGINKLRSGIMSQDQLNKVLFKVQSFGENGNFIPATCNTRNIADIVSLIRREVRNNGVKIAFIDHIGLIHPASSYKASWEGYREISNTIQQLQRELGIPIIVLSQVGRESEGNESNLASIRGSGAIEEDADTVMFIERERQKDVTETYIPTKINIVKNRNGSCGSCNLLFLPREVMFVDDDANKKD